MLCYPPSQLQNAEDGDTRELEAALQGGEAVRVERGKRGLLHLASAGGYLNALTLLLHYQADTSVRSSMEGDHGNCKSGVITHADIIIIIITIYRSI